MIMDEWMMDGWMMLDDRWMEKQMYRKTVIWDSRKGQRE